MNDTRLYAVERMGAHCGEWHVVDAMSEWPVWVSREMSERQLAALRELFPHHTFRITDRAEGVK